MSTTKKNRSLFFRKKDIVSKRKDVVSLKREKKKIENRLRDLADMYDIPEEWTERLPVSTLRAEFLTPPERQDDSINFVELRDKIREEHEEKVDDLEEIQSQLSIGQIDLLLVKIKCIEDNLNDTK